MDVDDVDMIFGDGDGDDNVFDDGHVGDASQSHSGDFDGKASDGGGCSGSCSHDFDDIGVDNNDDDVVEHVDGVVNNLDDDVVSNDGGSGDVDDEVCVSGEDRMYA